jgi:two-component system, NtrC family, sensor kinase
MKKIRAPGPDRVQVLEAVARLSLELGEPRREEELAHLFVQLLRDLLPSHHVCVRLVDPERFELIALFAEGPLRGDAKDAPIALRHDEMARLSLDGPARRRVVARRRYRPIFQDSAAGVAVPLTLSGKLYGLINVEAPEGRVPEPAFFAPLAATAAVALRNARMLTETEFLRDYLAKLLDHANALVLVCDRDRRITVFNRALERQTGFSRDEVIGQLLGRWLPESDDGLRRALAAALRGQSVAGFEARLPKKRGGTFRAVLNTAAVTTSDGQIEGIIAIGQDAGGVQALERQVIQAEKLATLGQLAAGVAHELGNPLTSILAYASHLHKKAERGGRDSGDAKQLRRIVEAAERMQKLTRELTQYARPDSDESHPLEINEVVDQALGFCEHLLGDAVTVLREYTPSLPPVHGARSQLQQVFINLITNARHAVEKRGTITLRSRLIEDHLVVEVRDDGRGIDERDLGHIFDPFFTTRAAGTGLGLSIVKSIVEAHGGTVRVDSRRGQGSTFSVALPAAKGGR